MININNKRWNELTFEDIEMMLSSNEEENFFFEFKDDKTDASKIIKEISAFANTYGGYIFIGVTDDKKIAGCTKWSEERITTTIYDSITPVPIFDVKKFTSPNNKAIFVIKIEEGIDPPYITNKGQIYERVSSSSFPIKDSSKLTQLFYKKKENDKHILDKITLEDISQKDLPTNLFGYLDVGFSVNASDVLVMNKCFFNTDYNKIVEFIKETNNSFSISNTSHSTTISLCNWGNRVSVASSMNNFIRINSDGSAVYRVILHSNPNDNKVDISDILILQLYFLCVYKIIFGRTIADLFISASKYQKLSVLKQFVPYFSKRIQEYSKMLNQHREKYGENLIISSNRIPSSGLEVIDKSTLNTYEKEYNVEHLINTLFKSEYSFLGFIDPPPSIV